MLELKLEGCNTTVDVYLENVLKLISGISHGLGGGRFQYKVESPEPSRSALNNNLDLSPVHVVQLVRASFDTPKLQG